MTNRIESLRHGRLLLAIRSALYRLYAFDRQLIALHFGGGLSHVQIAEALELPVATIHSRLSSAVANVNNSLNHDGIHGLVSRENLARAITTGKAAPRKLYGKVQQRILNALLNAGTRQCDPNISDASRFGSPGKQRT